MKRGVLQKPAVKMLNIARQDKADLQSLLFQPHLILKYLFSTVTISVTNINVHLLWIWNGPNFVVKVSYDRLHTSELKKHFSVLVI